MLTNMCSFARLGLCGVAALGIVLGQDPGDASSNAPFNARDMFYSASDMLKPAAGHKQRNTQADRASKPDQPPPQSGGNATRKPPVRPQPELAHSVPKDAEAHFQTVSQHSDLPLGLRYSLLKQMPGGDMEEVNPDSVFKSGDRIRISVMGNQKGFLYVVAKGSSGAWTPLFPHPESSQKRNDIVPGRKYQVPGGEGEYFTFNSQVGEEKVFILLSKTPVNDLESLIQTLSDGEPSRAPKPDLKVLQARVRVNDQIIDRLRQGVLSRDLVFTRPETQPGTGVSSDSQPPEEAVYVVNTKSTVGSNSRVVVDLSLNHQ